MAAVRREKDGVWSARVYLGLDALGRKIRPYKRFAAARDESDAVRMAAEWERGLRAGMLASGSLLADVLDSYVSMRERTGSAPSSVAEWRCFCRKVRRRMTRASAVDVTTRDLQDFELALLAPETSGGEGMSRNSVRAVHNFLRAAFRRIVAEGVRQDDPMASVEKPRAERHEDRSLGEWDMPLLLDRLSSVLSDADPASTDYAVAVAAWLALVTGMRVGETCALRRRDVRPRDPSVHVCGSVTESGGLRRLDVTKGRRSRTVSVTRRDMDQIMAVIAAQDSEMEGLGPDSPLVTTDGSVMRPSSVSRRFARMARDVGLPRGARFHMLRHTHATWCLSHGVDLKTVSLRLGHADETTTLRAYAHALPGSDSAAAETFSAALEESVEDCHIGVRRNGRGKRGAMAKRQAGTRDAKADTTARSYKK